MIETVDAIERGVPLEGKRVARGATRLADVLRAWRAS
jgi:hypothetical protein